MPLYEYACLRCKRHTEKIESVSGPHLKKCPHCGGKVESVITAPAIKFKGSGWYVNDYAAKTASGEGAKADGSSSDSKEPSSKDSSSKDATKDSGSKEPKPSSSKDSPKASDSKESSSAKDKKTAAKKD